MLQCIIDLDSLDIDPKSGEYVIFVDKSVRVDPIYSIHQIRILPEKDKFKCSVAIYDINSDIIDFSTTEDFKKEYQKLTEEEITELYSMSSKLSDLEANFYGES